RAVKTDGRTRLISLSDQPPSRASKTSDFGRRRRLPGRGFSNWPLKRFLPIPRTAPNKLPIASRMTEFQHLASESTVPMFNFGICRNYINIGTIPHGEEKDSVGRHVTNNTKDVCEIGSAYLPLNVNALSPSNAWLLAPSISMHLQPE